MSALERYYRARYERFKRLLGWRDRMPRLLEAVKAVSPDSKVYVFGSALRDELTANSDVDILIVSDGASGWQRHRLAAAIEERLEDPLIFEIHIVSKEELAWYRRNVKDLTPAELLLRAGWRG